MRDKRLQRKLKQNNKSKEDLPMKEMMKFFKDEEGQGMVEYGLIIGLIAVVVIAALVILGPTIANMFNKVSDNLAKLG